MYFKSVSSSFKNSVVSDSATPWTVAYQASLSIGFSRQKYWSGLPFPFQGIFPTQGLNPGLQHCRQVLYHLCHQGSPEHWLKLPKTREFSILLKEGDPSERNTASRKQPLREGFPKSNLLPLVFNSFLCCHINSTKVYKTTDLSGCVMDFNV